MTYFCTLITFAYSDKDYSSRENDYYYDFLSFLYICTILNKFLQNIPQAVTETVIGWNSIKRINLFFQRKDVDLKLNQMIEDQNHQ